MLSNRRIVVASAGYGVLFSLALSAAVHILSGLIGTPISRETLNAIFGVSCLIAAPLAAYLQVARLVLPTLVPQK